jgi:hypothetical protein
VSFVASAWAWTIRGLGHSAKLVLLALAESSSAEDETCYPSANFIAERCELGRATVFRAIDVLERRSLVARFPVFVNNEATSNTYLLNVQNLDVDRWTSICKQYEKRIRRGEVRRRNVPVQTVRKFEAPPGVGPAREEFPYPFPRGDLQIEANEEFRRQWHQDRQQPLPGDKQPGYKKRPPRSPREA